MNRSIGKARLLLTTLTVALLLPLPFAHGDVPSCCQKVNRPDDQIWEISVRGACCRCGDADCLEGARVFRLTGPCRWEESTFDAFLDSADMPSRLVFWVHGNRADWAASRQRGLDVYRALARHAGDDRPLRLVVFTWRSDQIRGALEDVRVKAARTDGVGYQLASALQMVPADRQVGLIGFSFGSRVISGALHVAGGGRLAGHRLSDTGPVTPRYRAVMMASAMHDYWLLPGRFHGDAVAMTEQMLLLNNACDPVLKRYQLIDPCSKPSALGYCGLASPQKLGDLRERVIQKDICCYIGRTHDLYQTICQTQLMAMAYDALFADEPPAPLVTPAAVGEELLTNR